MATNQEKLAPFAELVADPEVPSAKIAELADVSVKAVDAARAKLAAPAETEPEVPPALRALVEQLGEAVSAGSPEVPALIAQIRASEDIAKLHPDDRLGLEGMLMGIESGQIAGPRPVSTDPTDAPMLRDVTEETDQAAATDPVPPPYAVECTGERSIVLEDGRPLFLRRGDVFAGERAAVLWAHHRDLLVVHRQDPW